MDNKAVGAKIIKTTALLTGKAAWFLLCKGCLAVLLMISYLFESAASGDDEGEYENPYDQDLGNSANPLSPDYDPRRG